MVERAVQFLARQLTRWPIAMACVVVLAAGVLLPGLGSFGIWEPQERVLADKAAPRRIGTIAELRAIVEPSVQAALNKQVVSHDECKQAPPGALARSLTARAAGWGRDAIDDSDTGRRLPFALLGILTVFAAAGIALRAAGTRAALITALVLLSMPLLVLQSRQLTSEIGTAAGATLVIYGLGALYALTVSRTMTGLVDGAVGALALVIGLVIAFAGGGALLGLAVPLLAYAAAGSFGVSVLADAGRAVRNGGLYVLRTIAPRPRFGGLTHDRDALAGAHDTMGNVRFKLRTIASRALVGREPSRYRGGDVAALIAALGAIAVLGVLAYQLFALRQPQPFATPPQREVLDHAIVPTGCWSSALGGVWKPEDDLRYIWDSTFEQIAYGTFPWGVLAPIAMAALLGSEVPARRKLGALTLAWAVAAWIASEVFQRKVGFTLWAGFPALAIAVGVWIDAMLTDGQLPAGAKLVGLFVLLAAVDLGKDLLSFPERITSLLVGSDAIPYPSMAHLALVPTKWWILILAVIIGGNVAFVLGVDLRTPLAVRLRRTREGAFLAALVGTFVAAAFWVFGWQPNLAEHLSSKVLFDTYQDQRKKGDVLVIMGDYGDAPHDYAPDAKPEVLSSRDQVVAALGRPQRVFAIAPATERCSLHRELGGKPYYVLDDRNAKALLLSNRVDGTTDKNPLRTAILHGPPPNISHKPKGRVVYDNRVELLGWDIPKTVSRSSKFEVTLYYKVLQPVNGAFKVFMHFDGQAGRAGNGDHPPIDNLCPTTTWQPGDYIVDRFTVLGLAPAYPSGNYDVWTGLFTGENPNWRNMTVSEAPPDMRDNADRVKITAIIVD
jgi:hypothetical protein